ncbi:MAG: S9 family peptidase [Woeseiaceae bacterium]|nr:S9 family peptidase [Woeseiaceae bacterium]
MHRLSLVLFFFASVTFAVQHGDEPAVLRNVDVFDLEIASDVQISPDGRRVAYVRNSMDIMTDSARSNLWIVDVEGGEHRPLLSGPQNYSSPRWSPDGGRIAYVTAVGDRGAEIHARWMDSGQTAMLTNLPESPSSITWSPDGEWIAFSMFVPAEKTTLASPPAKPEGAQWAEPAIVIDRLYYRADGRGYLDTGNTHLFVVSADGGTPRQLTSGNYNHGGDLAWSPDGSQIVFSANRLDDYEYHPVQSELWSVDVESRDLRQLTDRDGPDAAPTFSPNGELIAYLGFDDRKMGYQHTGVYVMDADGSNVRALTADIDLGFDAVRWAGASNRLYVQYDESGQKHLGTLSLRGDLESIANDLSGVSIGRPYTSGSFSVADNGAYAYTAGTALRPADVAAGRRGAAPRKLTALNEDLLAHRTLGEVEEITWQSSADGLEIEGWIVKPPGFDPERQYPLILEIHGGPFTAYGPHFSAEVQLFAAAGYVVLYTNPRGSTSYGYDFANEIHHNYPGQDYDDLMSGVDAVIERGYVDEDQLFVTGGSGGGILTAWIVGQTDRFAAAVSAKPVINWISLVLTTDIAAYMPQYWFPAPPWENFEAYWSRSPLSTVGNVTTPTMLLTGEQDHRTPIPESEQYYQALKLRKVDTALVRIPGAPHGIAGRPSRLIAKVDNILGWFERYRKE